MSAPDTIAAIATAPGRAAVGIVRVSGKNLREMAQALTGRVIAARTATPAWFLDRAAQPVDQGIVLYFPEPRSYTGEDVLELHGHGGAIVMKMLLQRCLELGARLADPGEFTQRAFLNNKLDLLQAEGVIDLIDASSASAARGAIRSLHGEFSTEIHRLADGVTELRARIEAMIDFPEEEVESLALEEIRSGIDRLRGSLKRVLEAATQGSLLREGVDVVLVGRPNVGKSSLLNRLAGHERAIVTPVPGTTRDAIREPVQIGGMAMQLVDTAGIRESDDAIERIGVERTWAALEHADVALIVTEPGRDDLGDDLGRLPLHLRRLHVVNKIDTAGEAPRISAPRGERVVWVSAHTGAGMDLLREALADISGWRGAEETVYLARERHLTGLRSAAEHLETARECSAIELVAEELRLAHEKLMAMTGELPADDLLGEIFGRFCIGK